MFFKPLCFLGTHKYASVTRITSSCTPYNNTKRSLTQLNGSRRLKTPKADHSLSLHTSKFHQTFTCDREPTKQPLSQHRNEIVSLYQQSLMSPCWEYLRKNHFRKTVNKFRNIFKWFSYKFIYLKLILLYVYNHDSNI